MPEGAALLDVVISGLEGENKFYVYFYLPNFFKVGGDGNENHWLKLGPGDSLRLHLVIAFIYPNCLSKPQIGFIVLLVVTGLESPLKICIILSGACMKHIRIPKEVYTPVG